MALWQIVVVCVLAWISGTLFGLSVRRGRAGRDHERALPADEGPLGPWHWLTAPGIVFQLGLLAAFLAGAIMLIVLSL